MLKELFIENLAVIKKVSISFNNNFNVFTGETGAGKSILINGINAILGQRTTKDIVRNGCDKASICALFTQLSTLTKDKLDEFGLTYDNDEITLSRDISIDGKSVARINGRVVTVMVLKEIGETLINIHGQHDNQLLLKSECHIDILDSFADIQDTIDDYKQSFKELQEVARTINKLKTDERQKNERITTLKEKIDEISVLKIEEGEDEKLEGENELLQNAEKLYERINNALLILSGDDDNEGAIVATDNASKQLIVVKELMPELEKLSERLRDASIELDDITCELNHKLSALNITPERFEYVSERLECIKRIKRRYGPSLNDVLKSYDQAIRELEEIEGSSGQLEILEARKIELLAMVTEKAKRLTSLRNDAAKRFIEQVTQELSFLNMADVTLDVLHDTGKLTINGMDSIEFLISANKGEKPKPIAKIASGGELSRIMLALKNVIADKDDIPTLIFDEIDTGVSGRAAQKIGIKLSEISRKRQVLCVTHLAQIAVEADTHLCIEKNVWDDQTITQVKTLDMDGRKLEIARIMGGDNISDLLLKNAEQLILSSQNYKSGA